MPETYVLLERTELNASAASVTFANIPQTGYTDLKIVSSVRSSAAAASNAIGLYAKFNGITTGYSWRRLNNNSGTVSSDNNGADSAILIGACNGGSDTANTFTSSESYIPNFLGTAAKSISSDSTAENNSAVESQMLTAGLWSYSGNPAITSVTLNPSSGSFAAGSTFSLYGIAALGTTPAIAPKAYGGNVIATDGTYWYHAFLSSGSFVPQVGLTADCLVIAGGGGAGAGGGGAGGLVYNSATALANATNYSVTIGAGGTGGVNNSAQATNGVNSNITGGVLSLTAAVGGGKGGTGNRPVTNYDGGSGGGSNRQIDAAGVATSGQGSNGGIGFTDNASFDNGGGGGGFSVAGSAASFGACGAGGNGVSTYSSWGSATSTGQNVSGTYWYAGGGSGGTNLSKTVFAGGNGGGGAGAITGTGGSGTANTGGGGGGTNTGGAGGSGIVIIRYPIA